MGVNLPTAAHNAISAVSPATGAETLLVAFSNQGTGWQRQILGITISAWGAFDTSCEIQFIDAMTYTTIDTTVLSKRLDPDGIMPTGAHADGVTEKSGGIFLGDPFEAHLLRINGPPLVRRWDLGRGPLSRSTWFIATVQDAQGFEFEVTTSFILTS